MRANTRMSQLPASKEIMEQIGLQIQIPTPDQILYVFFARAGHIEESIFEVAVKMGDAANLVGGGSTDIRFTN